MFYSLRHHGTSRGGFVLPVGRELTSRSVVTGKTVDTALNKNESELGVLVFAIAFQMLADLDGLFDEHVEILWDFGSESIGLENADELLASNRLDLSNAVGITQDDTNLRGSKTLLGELADIVFDIRSRHLEPRRRSALVRESPSGDTLSWCMQTTHGSVFCVSKRLKE